MLTHDMLYCIASSMRTIIYAMTYHKRRCAPGGAAGAIIKRKTHANANADADADANDHAKANANADPSVLRALTLIQPLTLILMLMLIPMLRLMRILFAHANAHRNTYTGI